MKYWMRMGLAVMMTSFMMGYGQVSAQVYDDNYEVSGTSGAMSIRAYDDSSEVSGTSGPVLNEKPMVSRRTTSKVEKKYKTTEEIMAEFVTMLEKNPLIDLRQTTDSQITAKQLSSSKLAEVGKGYVYANLGTVGTNSGTLSTVGTTVAKVKDFAGMQNMKEGLKLGRYMDVYELQGTDQYGLNTAWVLVVPLPAEVTMSTEPYGKEGMSPWGMKMFTNDINSTLEYFHIKIGEDKDFDYSKEGTPAKIQLRNVEPLHTMKGTHYGTMTTAGNIIYDIKGAKYPGYLRLALVGTPGYFTTIVMGTTEVEGTFFKPHFTHMLEHIK